MPANEMWSAGMLVSGWEVVRVNGAATYREYDAQRRTTVERPASPDEEAMLLRSEEEQRNLARADALRQAVATLRTWSSQASGTTVTSGNAVATLQTVVTRLGIFFDRFADLLDHQSWRGDL